MIEHLTRLKRHIAAGRLTNEAAVRETAVLPVLSVVGWDVFDPEVVAREYPLGTGRVDYALAPRNGVPAIIIEVKRPGGVEHADQQLFQYAFHAGVPLAILTDGREWAFYLPSGHGSYSERRFYKLDLEERSEIDAAEWLNRYLGFENVTSGVFRRYAEEDYQRLRDSRLAIEAIPRAWSAIVRDQESRLFEMIAERAEDICGVRPPPEAIEEFLLSEVGDFRQGSAVPTPSRFRGSNRTDTKPSTAAPVAASADSLPDLTQRAAARRGPTSYEYDGETFTAPNAITATIALVNRIEHEFPGAIERAAPRVAGRRRRYLAKTPSLLYDKPEFIEFARKLECGWFIDSNISNGTKVEIVRAVAKAAGIVYGLTANLNFENAH